VFVCFAGGKIVGFRNWHFYVWVQRSSRRHRHNKFEVRFVRSAFNYQRSRRSGSNMEL